MDVRVALLIGTLITLPWISTLMRKPTGPMTHATASDGRTYKVGRVEAGKAAELLADINRRIAVLFDALRNESKLQRLTLKYKPEHIQEAPLDGEANDTSFSVNKRCIYLCLRSKADPRHFYPINLIMYVVLHELAHVTSETYGHNSEFSDNFTLLKNTAQRIGIFDPTVHSTSQEYCGMTIHSMAGKRRS